MSSTETATCLDALLAERPWLRRLASALTRDEETAEDLAQETWVTALSSPPRSATRTWLGKVFRSRLYDDSRARRRRELREQAVFDTSVEQIATPEEITARVELLRKVAEHMLALDENVRQVLYLRYLDGLEPVEIARRLSIPDGTVRWRVKQGLDELRTRLDADSGGQRRRWLALFAPSATPGWPSASTRPRRSWTVCFATMAGLIAVALTLGQWRCTASRLAGAGAPGKVSEIAATPPMAATTDVPSKGGALQVDAEPASPCPEAEALEAERDALADATKSVRRSAKDIFLQSPPNETVDQQLAGAVDAMIEKAGKCGHTFECRGQACRISLLVPESITRVKGWLALECFDAVEWDNVRARLWWLAQHDYAGFTFDPVARIGFKKVDMYFRLASQGTTPGESHPINLPAGWDRDRGPMPANLAPACRARVVRVRNELTALARQIFRTQYVNELFEQSTPRPELARELAGLLRPHLAAEGQPLPVEIACRGIVCTLMPRDDVAGSAVGWRCMSSGNPGGSSCWGRWDDDGWFARLVKVHLQLPLENVVPPVRHDGETVPAYVIFRPRNERQGVSGDWWVGQLVHSLDFAGMVRACERRNPAQGSLTIMARVPETCGLAEKPSEPLITLQYGGELMDSELADCLRMTIDQALARLEPPDCTFSWLHEWRLDFPHPNLELKASDEE